MFALILSTNMAETLIDCVTWRNKLFVYSDLMIFELVDQSHEGTVLARTKWNVPENCCKVTAGNLTCYRCVFLFVAYALLVKYYYQVHLLW